MNAGDLQLPPGFRFHPTDDELVVHYLCRKCAGLPISVPIIAELDLYKFDPWQLPDMALYGEKEWYFFSPRDRKYPNGSRPNRAAGSGYWKATGADKPIGTPRPVAIKKALVFYAGKAPKAGRLGSVPHIQQKGRRDRQECVGGRPEALGGEDFPAACDAGNAGAETGDRAPDGCATTAATTSVY